MDLNRAMIIGNVTRDPEVRSTSSGQSVASFGVATNRTWKDANGNKQEKAEFHNIVAWAKLADICAQYLTKGRKVYVEGRIETREWQGQDGQKRNRTEIIAENMIMLERGGAPVGGNQPTYVRPESAPTPSRSSVPAEEEIRVEDIPF